MPSSCPDPPSRPPRETLDRLIDLVAWAKTCMLITAATPPHTPARGDELEKLRVAVVEPRRLIETLQLAQQRIPDALLVDLRVCELAIPKLEAGAILRTSPREGSV